VCTNGIAAISITGDVMANLSKSLAGAVVSDIDPTKEEFIFQALPARTDNT
jgi:hypothetical protein